MQLWQPATNQPSKDTHPCSRCGRAIPLISVMCDRCRDFFRFTARATGAPGQPKPGASS